MTRRSMLAAIAVVAITWAEGACGGARGGGASGGPVSLVVPALDGGEIDTRGYAGKVVVLHLFTTWSLVAQGDLDQLGRLHEARPDDVTVIGIALDPDGYELVAPWRSANKIRYLIGLGGDAIASGRSPLGRVATVPTTVILDRRGRVARRIERPLGGGELERVVSALAPGR